jgi:hypothetical protein
VNVKSTVNPHYNGHNLAVYSWEFLEMLRHYEGFVDSEVFQIIKNRNIETSA